ncbi:zwei Ig domain protein zig-8 [Halyomorpha halys]|uniref:zwei Ig domain protein zig-8 n=1 Tax=Halyomorpha halys TaxID=286706 RepID=UPI0006D50692|nr:uncharacterized protein LOC106680638 [Halyomorpha halys]
MSIMGPTLIGKMDMMIILLSVCIQAQSAKQVAHDIKDVFLKGHNDDAKLDQLLNLLRQESTSPRSLIPEGTKQPQPYFEAGLSPANNTVQLGAEITLHCNVKDLSEETKVSWLRRHGDKLSLLSVGEEKYSSEPRYSPSFRGPHDWQLRLQNARHTDQGVFECQVSSHPPIVQRFYLKVVVPELEIADERGLPIRNKFYNSGSTIELKCMVSKIPQPLHFIMWRVGDKVLNFDTMRGGISVKTDVFDDGAMSRLFIANANQYDSGNYTCSLGELAHASVIVVVLNGEAPAAMHIGRGSNISPSNVLWVMAFISTFYTRWLCLSLSLPATSR